MGLVDFLVLGLAAWRLTSLLVNEDGPWNIFARFRHWVGVRFNEKSEPYGTNFLADGLTCVWCTSVWVGVCLTVWWAANEWLTPLLCLPFALSTLSILVQKITGDD